MKKVFQFILSSIKTMLILIGLFIVLKNTILGVEDVNLFYPDISTHYSSGFDKNIFRNQIKNGMFQTEVEALLGKPLDIEKHKDIFCGSAYRMTFSSDKNLGYTDFAWRGFHIYLDENLRVIHKEEKWWED